MTGMRSETYLRRSGVEMDGWVRNEYVQGREIMESILQNYGQEQTQNEFPSATVRKGRKRLTMKQEKTQVEKTHSARLLSTPPRSDGVGLMDVVKSVTCSRWRECVSRRCIGCEGVRRAYTA